MPATPLRLGFVGVGAMGAPMAANLLWPRAEERAMGTTEILAGLVGVLQGGRGARRRPS